MEQLPPEMTIGELREHERQQRMDDHYASLEKVNRLLAILGEPLWEYRLTGSTDR